MSYEKLLTNILNLAELDDAMLDAEALATAKLSFYDWLVVSCAASAEPLAVILRDFIASEGGNSIATVTGASEKFPARAAALANGAISHALDYDDNVQVVLGHTSAVQVPALLALGEAIGASGQQLVDAYIVGFEIQMALGRGVNWSH